jgi:hypothetical protein
MRPKGRRARCTWRQRTQPLLRRLVACPSPTLEAVNLRHVGNVRYSSHEPPGYWTTWRVSVDNVACLGRRKRAILTRWEDERRLTRRRRRRNLRNEREILIGELRSSSGLRSQGETLIDSGACWEVAKAGHGALEHARRAGGRRAPRARPDALARTRRVAPERSPSPYVARPRGAMRTSGTRRLEPLLAAVEAPTSSNHDFSPLRFGRKTSAEPLNSST